MSAEILPTDPQIRCNVLGVGVSAVNRPLALRRIAGWIARGDHQYVCITGVHGVMESQSDEKLRRIHNSAGMVSKTEILPFFFTPTAYTERL